MNLDLASANIQVQTLELLRRKRVFTRTAMHTARDDLLFIVVVSQPGARLSHHLNDIFAIAHYHAEEDGYLHTDGHLDRGIVPTITSEDIQQLRSLAKAAVLTAEVATYLHNVVVFMRMSRYVKGGVTATATRHLRALAQALAPLHGLTYVTPSLVALAVRKVYPHRLVLATAETERSLQWGSNPEAVRHLLHGLTVEHAIEEVLASVEMPL